MFSNLPPRSPPRSSPGCYTRLLKSVDRWLLTIWTGKTSIQPKSKALSFQYGLVTSCCVSFFVTGHGYQQFNRISLLDKGQPLRKYSKSRSSASKAEKSSASGRPHTYLRYFAKPRHCWRWLLISEYKKKLPQSNSFYRAAAKEQRGVAKMIRFALPLLQVTQNSRC